MVIVLRIDAGPRAIGMRQGLIDGDHLDVAQDGLGRGLLQKIEADILRHAGKVYARR